VEVTAMKTGKWLLLTAAIAFVTGCAQQPKEFEPVRLEKAIDLSQTQYKQVDLTTATEVDLVEELHKVRADYRRLLEIMLQWYMDRGYYQRPNGPSVNWKTSRTCGPTTT